MDARWMNQTPTDPLLLEVMQADVDYRRALRRQIALRCDVISHYWEEPVEHLLGDLTAFGAWVDTLCPLHRGAEVVMCFSPPGGQPLTVFGEVRRVVTGRLRSDRGRLGMGIAFTNMSYDEMCRVDRSLRGVPPRRPAAKLAACA